MQLNKLFIMSAFVVCASSAMAQKSTKTTTVKTAPAAKPVVVEETTTTETVDLSTHASSSDTFMNARVNALGLLLGAISLDLDFKLGESFTLGPRLSFFTRSSGTEKVTAFGFGARANIYLGRPAFSDSWYIGPSFDFNKGTSKIGGVDNGSTSGYSIAALVGYQWVWPSNFNMNFGAGLQYVKLDTDSAVDLSGMLPSLEFTLGYAF